jgi:hypothetical protein
MRKNCICFIDPVVLKRCHHRGSGSEATYEDRNCRFVKSVEVAVSDSVSLEVAEILEPQSERQKKKIQDLEAACAA